jgi:Leucine-rich repeat (LRR) protein
MRSCGGLSDISPLAGLTSLEKLDLSHCFNVTDLTPLAGLPNLFIYRGCSLWAADLS